MDAPLADRLQALADDVRSHGPDFADVVERMIGRLKVAGAGLDSPKPGEPMPDFLLPDQNGRLVSLSSLIENGPVVVSFHRGHWCPYCRINARALAGISADVRLQGASLAAITPELEHFTAELGQDARADFPILSDIDNSYAMLLNLAFYVGDEKKRFMTQAGWDIGPFNGNEAWTLPIPATFVIGRDGTIAARFVDPDYRKRMDIETLMTEVKRAGSSA
jgi:peroxiredoxin